MKKVVLDSNIYVSAFAFGGKPQDIVKLGLLGYFRIVISEFIIHEVKNVCVHKLGFKDDELSFLLDEIMHFSDIVLPKVQVVITKSRGDNVILATAIEGNADFIVTGDKAHLLPLKEYRGIKIVTVKELLYILKAFPE